MAMVVVEVIEQLGLLCKASVVWQQIRLELPYLYVLSTLSCCRLHTCDECVLSKDR